ncbi:MAG: DUF5107 domain-containing protein [Clostridia bacterium]|nr:DUF5107 domain-containing protein [Clostridia bacterium]
MKKVSVYEQAAVIPTYRAGELEKNPLFIEKRAYQGSTGKVYPVPICESVSETREDVTYKAVILENDYLYVMILPELGGRIQRALDKTNNYDFVYYNRVIKPALVGLAGPWISGGIEFNWPQHHRPSTFMPVDYTFSENPDGSATVILGETDRINGTKANAGITLYPDKAYIEIKGRLFNPTDYPQTFLWWANPAVHVNGQTFSVFPPDVNAVMDHGKRAVSTFPIATGEYYKADYSAGVDISRYKNIRVPTSYMAAHSDFDFVGNFDEGKDAGLLHVADHHISPGKKQWTWGCGDFGKMWDKNLTDEDGPYIELMTGVYCDNQPDFTWLKPQEEKTFVQYFMPYKTVGRVSNATKDMILGVDYLDKNGRIIDPDPFAFGREANETVRGKAAAARIKAYATGEYKNAQIVICSGGKVIYQKTADLSPQAAFVDTVKELRDYEITVCSEKDELLCAYREYVKENRPIPDPAEALKKPEEIQSLEELYLAGQHLEQYRHATLLPADYYLEGLGRDATDIRLNNAYGLYLLRNAQIEESVKYFEAAIKKQTWRNPNPYAGEAYFNLGLALELLGKLPEACDAFFKAAWSAETAGPAYHHLACICVKRGDLKKALQFADESLLRGWHNMKTRSLKASILAHLDKESAVYWSFLEDSLAIDPLYLSLLCRHADKAAFDKATGGRIEEYLNVAYEYIGFGFYEDAIEVLKACRLESPMKHYALAYAESLLDFPASAAPNAAEAGEKAPSDYCFPNRVMESLILKNAVDLLESSGRKAPMAHYYLGELLYDKKQYAQAVFHWQEAVKARPDLAPAHRNLSIAYYNHGEKALALPEIAEAVRLEPGNSRFLLEQEQLLKRLERPVKERLAILEAHQNILPGRYALMLAYVSLLNQDGQHEKALELMTHYTFHVWEGGEGKVADEYKTALFALAEKTLAEGKPEEALAYARRTLTYPDNLGEGKLDNVPDNRAYYTMGCAYRVLGDEAQAKACFEKATLGAQTPEPVRYYNDQPSDYIYYQGLAFAALGDMEMAKKSFHQLIIFGERHIFDKVDYDFFAVSMPELEVYQDDIQKRSDDYCKRLMALGYQGLREIEKKDQ